ncbi:MAG: head decoration protein [Hyphomonas sp.]|nr:head decoration protein [Hyphomonas sp.]
MSLHIGTMARAALLSNLLAREVEPEISREEVTVLAGSGSDRELKMGTVIAKLTTGGKAVQLLPGAETGAQTAWGVLLEDVTAPDGVDAPGVAFANGPILLRKEAIVWPAGISDANKAAAIAALAAKLIKIR